MRIGPPGFTAARMRLPNAAVKNCFVGNSLTELYPRSYDGPELCTRQAPPDASAQIPAWHWIVAATPLPGYEEVAARAMRSQSASGSGRFHKMVVEPRFRGALPVRRSAPASQRTQQYRSNPGALADPSGHAPKCVRLKTIRHYMGSQTGQSCLIVLCNDPGWEPTPRLHDENGSTLLRTGGLRLQLRGGVALWRKQINSAQLQDVVRKHP
jgi:hypothetical protein